MGMFGGNVDFLSEREDEIGIQFRSYRSKKTTSGILYILGAAGIVGSVLLPYDQYSDHLEISTGLLVGSLGLLIAGGAVDVSAHESLSKSLWLYNGTLSTDGALPGPGQEKEHGETPQEPDLR
jgi:hypothetical protein